jgi:hypothetical protein
MALGCAHPPDLGVILSLEKALTSNISGATVSISESKRDPDINFSWSVTHRGVIGEEVDSGISAAWNGVAPAGLMYWIEIFMNELEGGQSAHRACVPNVEPYALFSFFCHHDGQAFATKEEQKEAHHFLLLETGAIWSRTAPDQKPGGERKLIEEGERRRNHPPAVARAVRPGRCWLCCAVAALRCWY